MDVTINPRNQIKGVYSVPGDKSISHRAIMIGALSDGTTVIEGFLQGDDCLHTIECFIALGIDIEIDEQKVTVHGKGLHGLRSPSDGVVLDVGNSGTTLRLMAGILSGQSFTTKITGDESIQRRPMKRVIAPLRQMGADISGVERDGNIYAPLTITGRPLNAIHYVMEAASAQLKSAVIFASLYAAGVTTIDEPRSSRDHTEIMLNYFSSSCSINKNESTITCQPINKLHGQNVIVPGDISSASFLIVASLILQNSEIVITNVIINPTRTGIIPVLKDMGGDIEILNPRLCCGEKVGDIRVRSSRLNGTVIAGDLIPTLIDEVPILAVAACYANGRTIIKDAGELKIKESNRINAMTVQLTKLGANVLETEDGLIIDGGCPLHGAEVESYKDHRVAMSLAVAGLGLKEGDKVVISDSECCDVSFPGFFELLHSLDYPS